MWGQSHRIALTPPVHQWSRFCRRMERTTAGNSSLSCSPLSAAQWHGKNPDGQGGKGGDFQSGAAKIRPDP
ncbi:hypothetical protein VSQ48_22820 [Candidatus Ventrimonas sp. KK005]